MSKLTDHAKILAYMKEHGSITAGEGYKIGCPTKVTTRISELRKKGHKIVDVWETREFPNGEKVRYKRYFMGGTNYGRQSSEQ